MLESPNGIYDSNNEYRYPPTFGLTHTLYNAIVYIFNSTLLGRTKKQSNLSKKELVNG
jgi:hypothetical protein